MKAPDEGKAGLVEITGTTNKKVLSLIRKDFVLNRFAVIWNIIYT